MNIVEKAKNYAIRCHRNTNHLYDGQPYELHLKMVYDFAKKYEHLIPDQDRDNFLAAAWTHDLIEDCRETYNDVLAETNKEVADLTYALTNEKGKTRKERANTKYYSDMKAIPYAPLLKVCDRLANFTYSVQKNSRMAQIYARENAVFISQVNDGRCDQAIHKLIGLQHVVEEQNNG